MQLHTPRGSGVEQIRLPMADHSLRYINAYLIEGDQGYALIDCGWGTPDVLSALEQALGDVGRRLQDIRTIVVTHFHSDHYGLAGLLAQTAGARILMHRADWTILDTHFRDLDHEFETRETWLRRNGLSADYASGDRIRRLAQRMTLVAPDAELHDDEVLELGGRRLRIVWTPGHSPGHVCLYEESERRLFSGDHVLPQITPHVGFWDGDDPDPLGTFLASLRKVASLGASSALPAHREPIDDLGARVEEIIDHHEERERQVIDALTGGSYTGADVAAKLPWRRARSTFEELPLSEKTFALVETLAHLEHLRGRGYVVREPGEPIRYRRV